MKKISPNEGRTESDNLPSSSARKLIIKQMRNEIPKLHVIIFFGKIFFISLGYNLGQIQCKQKKLYSIFPKLYLKADTLVSFFNNYQL